MQLKLEFKALVGRVEALWNDGQLEVARELIDEAITCEPEVGQLWELLGLAAFESNDLTVAQSALERASLLCPLTPRGQVALAKCYDGSGHRESAAAIYCHVAKLGGLDANLLEPLATGLGRAGELELALDVCRRAARLMPDNPDPLVGIVHYMRRLRRPLELILPTLFRAHHLDPENAEYRISLAWMLYQLDRSEEAAYLLKPVPFAESVCIRCLTLMKQVFERAGDDERAAVCRWRLESLAGDCSLRRAGRESDSED